MEKIDGKNMRAMEHVEQIKEQGFTKLNEAYDSDTVGRFKNCIAEYSTNHSEVSDFIYNLQNKNLDIYLSIVRNSQIKEILKECLNDDWYKQLPKGVANFILRGLVARSSGETALKMHLDSFVPSSGKFIWNMIMSIALDETNETNGPTFLVPKSHRFDEWASSSWLDKSITVYSKPGDVLIWDSRLWHGAGANTSGGTRWAIIATFSRWWIKQTYNMPESFPKEYLPSLSDEEKAILGFCNNTPRDENDRVNIQGGFELLP
jgi:hypothetical protein